MRPITKTEEAIATLRSIYTIDQHLTGFDYLKAFTKNIAKNLGFKCTIIGHAIKPDKKMVQYNKGSHKK